MTQYVTLGHVRSCQFRSYYGLSVILDIMKFIKYNFWLKIIRCFKFSISMLIIKIQNDYILSFGPNCEGKSVFFDLGLKYINNSKTHPRTLEQKLSWKICNFWKQNIRNRNSKTLKLLDPEIIWFSVWINYTYSTDFSQWLATWKKNGWKLIFWTLMSANSEEQETSIYVVTECPAISSQRRKCFGLKTIRILSNLLN